MITIHPRTTRTTLSSISALVGGDSYVSIFGAHRFFEIWLYTIQGNMWKWGEKSFNDASKPLEMSTKAILDMCKIMVGSKEAKIDDHSNQQTSNLQWEQGILSMLRGCVLSRQALHEASIDLEFQWSLNTSPNPHQHFYIGEILPKNENRIKKIINDVINWKVSITQSEIYKGRKVQNHQKKLFGL